MFVKRKQKNSDINKSKDFWLYSLILWVILWIVGAVLVFSKVEIEPLITLGIMGFPLILCAFLIPLIILYNKSKVSFKINRKAYEDDNTNRPKIITGLCYLYIPILMLAIFAILLFPDAFKEYGPKFGAAYSYITAVIFFMYLFSLLGYWFMKKWSVYLYIFIFIFASIIHHYYFDVPVKIFGIFGNLLIIAIGINYILKRRESSA